MARLLFVCTGNICRSPFAERYAAKAQLDGRLRGWEFASAGLAAVVGSPIEERMARELEHRGCDTTGFEARQLSAKDLQEADLIIPMEARQRSQILLNHPMVVRRTFTLGQLAPLATSFPRRLSSESLLEAIGEQRQAPRPEDDVSDPYGRGGRVALRTSARISDLLDNLLPRLTIT